MNVCGYKFYYMEKYLLKLIKENNRIIIPNFGAFIVSYEKGQNILFNNFLSFNDGLLISHICSVEGIDSAAAEKKVENYVADINKALNNDGFFVIKDIGRFSKDDSGFIRFEQAATVPVSEVGPGEVEDKISVSDSDIEALTEDTELLDLDTGSLPVYHETPDLEAEAKIEEEAPESSFDDKTTEVVVKERGKISGGLVALSAILLLLLVGAYLWFFTDVINDYKEKYISKPQKEQLAEPSDQALVPVVPSDSLLPVEPEIVSPEGDKMEDPASVSTRQHHVIVGSYKDEAKAFAKVQELAAKGYSSASVLPYEGRYLASVECYPSVRTALRRQEELLSELQAENWVLSLSVR